MFDKVLVANRGEIAIRALRAGYELGARTVAVFPYEDRNSLHRFKADEAYQIGIPGHPVRAYLSIEEIVGAAVRCGASHHLQRNRQVAVKPADGSGHPIPIHLRLILRVNGQPVM